MKQERWGIVVDDRPRQAEAIAKVLTTWGLHSKGFTDPDEAVTFAQQHRGFVVFAMFDICLGEKSGVDYARIFRERQLSHDIILMTAYPDIVAPEVSRELEKLGVPIYEKPVPLESLLAEKLDIWRTITPDEMAQRSTPDIIQTTKSLDDVTALTTIVKALDSNTEATTKQNRQIYILTSIGILVAMVSILVMIAVSLFPSDIRSWLTQSPAPTSTQSTAPTTHLVIAEGMQPVAGPVYVAYEKHFWKDLGLDVELVSFNSGRLCLDAVLGGKADAGTMAETPIMNAGFQGVPIYVVAGIHRSQKNTKVIARKDKGIAKPSDLKGHKAAVSIGTNGEFFMDQFLRRIGLTRKDIEVVNVRPEDMVASLIRGDVAASFTWEPHIQNVKRQLNDKAVIFGNDGVYEETYNIVTAQSFAKSNPNELNLLLQGLAKAIDYMHENPYDSIGIVSRHIGMDADLLKAIWPDYTFQLSLDQSFLDLLNQEAKWSKDNGIAPPGAEIPNYRLFILTEPLKAIKPEAVTIN